MSTSKHTADERHFYQGNQPARVHCLRLSEATFHERDPMQVQLIFAKGQAWVVLHWLALLQLDSSSPYALALEDKAIEWANTLPPHHHALDTFWVEGFDAAPLPCLRWPLLLAFVQQWPADTQSAWQQRLLRALERDGEQLGFQQIGQAPRGRTPKITDDTVRQLYRLLQVEGKTHMAAAAALGLGASTCKEIAAGRYPFSTVTAKDAWRETFGCCDNAPANGLKITQRAQSGRG